MKTKTWKKVLTSIISFVMLAGIMSAAAPVSAAAYVTVMLDEADVLRDLELGADPNKGGWYKTAASLSNTLTLTDTVPKAAVEAMPSVKSGKIYGNASSGQAGIQMYKLFADQSNNATKINLTANVNYHLSWKQYLPKSQSYNGTWGRGSYLAITRGYGTNVYESIRIGFVDEFLENSTCTTSDYYPAILYCSGASTTSAANAKNTVYAAEPAEQGVLYVCDAYITGAASGNDKVEFVCYPYGSSEEYAQTVTAEFESKNTFSALKFHNYGSAGDTEGITDLKLEKMTGGNWDTLRPIAAAFNPDFSAASTQADFDKLCAYTPVGNETLTWQSNNESVIKIEDNRPVLLSADAQACLTAVFTLDGVSIEKSFPIEVKTDSCVILSDDLSNIPAGTSLEALGAEEEKGWSGGYTAEYGVLSESKVVDTPYGKMINLKSVKQDDTKTTTQMQYERPLASGLDMDSDRTYYITWNQRMSDWKETLSQNQRLQLFGATIDGVEGEIAPQFNISGKLSSIAANYKDSDLLPARLFIKYGANSSYASITNFAAVKGQTYTFVARIDASSTGNDTIYLKAYPTGTPALTDWIKVGKNNALTVTANITGTIDSIGFMAYSKSEDTDILYGDFKIDSINLADVTAFEKAEAYIKAGDRTAAEQACAGLMDGAWKSELMRELATLDDTVVGAAVFKQDDIMVSKLADEKDISVKINITNNTDQTVPCVVAGALMDDGIIKSVSVSEAKEAAAGSTGAFELTVANEDALSENAQLKLFVWNSLDGVKPLSEVITLDKYQLIQ